MNPNTILALLLLIFDLFLSLEFFSCFFSYEKWRDV